MTRRSSAVSRRSSRLTVALLAALCLFGCGDDGATEPQPQPGQLRVILSGGTAPAGAVVLTVTGPGISSPVPAGGAALYHDLAGGTLSAVVVGASLGGEILRFSVSDVNQIASYAASMRQVAGPDNFLLEAGGFTVAVVR